MPETDHVQEIRTALESASESTSRRIDDEERMILACDIDRALASLSALQEERERMRRDSAILAWLWEHGTAAEAVLIRQAEEAIDAAMEPAPQEGRS